MNKRFVISIVIVSAVIISGVTAIIINTFKDKKNKDDILSSVNSDESFEKPEKSEPDSSVADSSVPDSSVSDSSSKSEKDTVREQVTQAMAGYTTLSYYKPDKKQAYIDYKIKNSTVPYEKCIVYVNIGLDKPFYTNIAPSNDYTSLTAIVNKYYALPSAYVPALVKIPAEFDYAGGKNELRVEAKDAFVALCTDAKAQGFTIKSKSTYRSYTYQNNLYNNYVKQDGKANADTYSARPGHSEHQTGLAIDVIGSKYTNITSFSKEKEYPFVKENAHKYGFVIRYPENSSHITGYKEEPWHLRYVGVELATKLYTDKITLDEYYAMYK